MDSFFGRTLRPPPLRLAEARDEVARECLRLGFEADVLLRPSLAEKHRLHLATPMAELALNLRTVNLLEEHFGCVVASDVLALTPDQILSVPNLSDKTLVKIRAALRQAGFSNTNGRRRRRRLPGRLPPG